MSEQIKQQYNSLYAASAINFGDGEPLSAVIELPRYLLPLVSILDIGGGEGRNALYLAKLGFRVSVLDISEVGLSKLNNLAKKHAVFIQTKVGDMVSDGIESYFDAIINTFVLFHLKTEDAHKVIKQTKEKTNLGGINLISTFSNKGGLALRNKNSGRFYPSKTRLQEIYADWEIIELTEHEILSYAKNKSGQRLINGVVTLIARKVSETK